MELPVVVRGALLGFTVAAAVGPIALLTVRRTLAHGPRYGLVSGIGVATADATYAAVAAFGLTAVTSALVGARAPLGVVGGAVLVWLGARTMTADADPARTAGQAIDDASTPGLAGAYLSILGLTLTNPLTIVSFAGIFAAAGLATSGVDGAALLTAGVFLGSAAWWVALVAVVARLRSRITVARLRVVNRVSGLVLVAFGLAALASAAAG